MKKEKLGKEGRDRFLLDGEDKTSTKEEFLLDESEGFFKSFYRTAGTHFVLSIVLVLAVICGGVGLLVYFAFGMSLIVSVGIGGTVAIPIIIFILYHKLKR